MKLNPIFTNHIIFQAEKPIRFYGEGSGTVTVTLNGATKTEAFSGDSWLIELPPMAYGGPYTAEIELNGEKTLLSDVFVGEVLLLAGQSNIELTLGGTNYPVDKYESNSMLRCFALERFNKNGSITPADGWFACDKDDRLGSWSAIGYHLGQLLTKKRGIAVGLIFCYQGASVIESWMPAELAAQEKFYLPKEEKYDSPFVHTEHNENGALYNAVFRQTIPYSVGNVIWYQGCSNTGPSEYKIYTDLLCTLIDRWRQDLMDEVLPFTVVQIADWDQRDDAAWKGIQQAQLKITEVRGNVKTVISADLCEVDDIHPPTKHLLARRIYKTIFE
ncbi:MAG: hypothetical protein J6B93_03380 [Clostridia bacterium]|nr:hypothetical protein [Clostridia bacterium]